MNKEMILSFQFESARRRRIEFQLYTADRFHQNKEKMEVSGQPVESD